MIWQMFSFMLPLLYFVGVTSSLVFLTKRSFGKCLPIAMMGSAFLLFFSQLVFGTFNVGFVIGILCAVASVGLAIWRRKRWKEYRKLLFSSGFIVFVAVYVLVFIYDFARGFTAWDEFSHWGMMLKEMLRLDKFYSVEASNLLVHKDYPPIMQLFELFWVKLGGGEYKEVLALRALHTFELSLFIPFVTESSRKKDIWKSIVVAICGVSILMLTMLLFDQHGVIQTIYTDYVMAMVTAFLLMVILSNKKISWFEIVTIVIGGGFLLLLKQMGLPLYLMIICFLVGTIWIRKNVTWKDWVKQIGWKKLVYCVLALVVPLVIWHVWGRLVADTAQQFDLSRISLTEFIKILLGYGEEWQSYTIKQFIMALGQENISTSFIQISYLQSMVLFGVTMWGAWWLYRKQLIKKEIVWLTIILLIGAVGYAMTMMILYVQSFSENEAIILASFNRYMGTYAMLMMFVVIMIVIWKATDSGKRTILYITVTLLALLNAPSAYGRIYPYIGKEPDYMNGYGEMVDFVARLTSDGDRIFVVTEDASLKDGFYLQYYLNTRSLNYGLNSWPNDDKKTYNEVIRPSLKEYDYIFVLNGSKEYAEDYCGLFGECPGLNIGLYKINKDSNGELIDYKLIERFNK